MVSFRRGSALIIANAIIFVVAAIAMFVLEKVLPVAQGTRGVENSNMAYYRAQEGAEGAMMQLDRRDAFKAPAATGGTNSLGYAAASHVLTPVIPSPGRGNSDYDQDWNKIGANDPVQLALTGNITWANVDLYVRVPDLDGSGGTLEELSGAYYAANSGVVAWSLASDNGNFLNPSGESETILYGTHVGTSQASPAIKLNAKNGRDQASVAQQFQAFAFNGGDGHCEVQKCTLRLSTLRPLLTASGQLIPYLEYKIDFSTALFPGPGAVLMPDRFVRIASQGNTYGFRRDIEKKVPQTTAVQGLDVTVFN